MSKEDMIAWIVDFIIMYGDDGSLPNMCGDHTYTTYMYAKKLKNQPPLGGANALDTTETS